MKILLSHGRGGSPNDKIIAHLAREGEKHGCTCERIDDQDTQNPDTRAARLVERIEKGQENVILVGFSMGGYACVLAAERCAEVRGLFLIAPGLFLPRYQQSRYRHDLPNLEIVHGWDDDVVLYEHSLRFARDSNAPLHLLPGDHLLHAQIPELRQIFACYLQRIINN